MEDWSFYPLMLVLLVLGDIVLFIHAWWTVRQLQQMTVHVERPWFEYEMRRDIVADALAEAITRTRMVGSRRRPSEYVTSIHRQDDDTTTITLPRYRDD